jgi:hypothetical protein
MGEILKLLRDTIQNHFVILVGLSLGWVAVYLVLKAGKILLIKGFLFFAYVRNHFLGGQIVLDKRRKAFFGGGMPDTSEADKLSRGIEVRLNELDSRMSQFETSVIVKIVFDKSDLGQLTRELSTRSMMPLEKDWAMYSIFSSSPEKRESALLNFMANPATREPEVEIIASYLASAADIINYSTMRKRKDRSLSRWISQWSDQFLILRQGS